MTAPYKDPRQLFTKGALVRELRGPYRMGRDFDPGRRGIVYSDNHLKEHAVVGVYFDDGTRKFPILLKDLILEVPGEPPVQR